MEVQPLDRPQLGRGSCWYTNRNENKPHTLYGNSLLHGHGNQQVIIVRCPKVTNVAYLIKSNLFMSFNIFFLNSPLKPTLKRFFFCLPYRSSDVGNFRHPSKGPVTAHCRMLCVLKLCDVRTVPCHSAPMCEKVSRMSVIRLWVLQNGFRVVSEWFQSVAEHH